MQKVEGDHEVSRSRYASQTARGEAGLPVRSRNEYAYTQWGGANDWAHLVGNWMETRDPTIAEVASIEGGAETRIRGIRRVYIRGDTDV